MLSKTWLYVLLLVSIFAIHSTAKSKYALNPLSAKDIGSFVKEPSGASFSELTGSLWVICDKPSCHFIYEMDTEGVPIREWKFKKDTHDDIEAVAVDDEKQLIYIAEEGYMRVTSFLLPQLRNSTSFKKDGSDYELIEINQIPVDIDAIRSLYYTEDPTDRPGLEGMTINTKNNTIIVANEKEPPLIVHINATTGEIFYVTHLSYSVDLSGLNYDPVLDLLWVLSDKDQRVFLTDLFGETVLDYWDLPMENAEGIAIDNNQDPALMYIVTDPSSPHGKQYIPALFIFTKPVLGTGLNFGKNIPPAVECDGCSSLYAELEDISTFISSFEEEEPAVFTAVAILVSLLLLLVFITCVVFVVATILVNRNIRMRNEAEASLLETQNSIDAI